MRQRGEAMIRTDEGRWLVFEDPVRVLEARHPGTVAEVLADVERLTRDLGYHAVGLVTYEAGAAFGLAAKPAPAEGLPLAWFSLFEPSHVREVEATAAEGTYRLANLAPSIDREQFGAAFERVKRHLADGDTYQVNVTFRMRGAFEGDARRLFLDLVEAQQGRYAAFLSLDNYSICSASPELFFSLKGLEVAARPMKGTAARGRTIAEDAVQREELRGSPKQRAENVMIVDMVRNDLGRIADVGTVEVPELFVAERYPNMWQMTSLVTARSRAPLEQIFEALHPSASVTGAPKVRTMELLRDLEAEPRGIYTGAIGHVSPDGNARFSVAIRTAVVDHAAHTVEFGIGSGIVWDSDAEAEYAECLLKGSVLAHSPSPFQLLETLRWEPDSGFLLLDRHLARLKDSADFFGFACDVDAARRALDRALTSSDGARRVRLLVAKSGAVTVEQRPFVPSGIPLRVALAAGPVDTSDVFLFHKTTNREAYDRSRLAGWDDVILWNQDRQVTEATTANVVVESGGELVTPPVACGLLAGTFRAEMLARGELREKVMTVDELRAAGQLWLINSVHGRREAQLGESS